MTHSTSVAMLRIVSILSALFGCALVLAVATPVRHGFNLFVDLAFLPLDGGQSLDSDTATLMTAIGGALLVGFSTLVYLITRDIYNHDPSQGRRLLIPALLAWYIPDSLGSFAAGAWFNVVMNTGFLALFLVPLLLSRPHTQAA